MYDVVCLGEAMLRLTPPHHQRIEQANSLEVTVGGSELNTAAGLARLGLQAAWVSKLPRNPLGRTIAGWAGHHGVDTSHIVWSEQGRAGLYFVEEGASPRASQVLYDRQGAAITTLQAGEVDWAQLLPGVKVFHTSGITPALGPQIRATTEQAIAAARQAGCLVSLDLNYRSKLWGKAEAAACLGALLTCVDILLSTSDDLETLFGLGGSPAEVAAQARARFGLQVVAITVREAPTVLHGFWSSVAVDGQGVHGGRRTELELVDRVGSGDAYTAGFLYGYLTGDIDKAIAYGDAMSALKHSIPGDFAWVTAAEVAAFAAGAGTKIVR